MRYSDTELTEKFALFLTGDGMTERRILRTMANKFNGKSLTLFAPVLPVVVSSKGLVSILSAMKSTLWIVNRARVNVVLLLDKEHVENLMTFGKEIEKIGGNFKVEHEGPSFTLGEMRLGSKIVTIYLIVLGVHAMIEENLAVLIKECFDQVVESNKKGIRDFYEKNRINVEGLIENADIDDLKKSFPGLVEALIRLESDLS